MSKSREVRAATSLKVVGFMLAGSLFGQAPAAVPVDQEPQHRVVFKNEFVRIIDATLPAGYVTLNHTHDADNRSNRTSGGFI